MSKKIIKYLLLLLCIPLIILGGSLVFKDKQYAYIIIAVTAVSMIPFFMTFEHKETDTEKIIIIAVMTALSVTGRFIFGFVPHFKPVAAIVIITGIYLGGESGFLCGALSAVLSDFIFGQGPWTPFQMFAWGIVGLLAAVFKNGLKKSRIVLCIFGALASVLYSFIMDIWTTLWADGTFNISRFVAAITTAIPVTITYAVSNCIFLLLLSKPIGDKIERIKMKYGIK